MASMFSGGKLPRRLTKRCSDMDRTCEPSAGRLTSDRFVNVFMRANLSYAGQPLNPISPCARIRIKPGYSKTGTNDPSVKRKLNGRRDSIMVLFDHGFQDPGFHSMAVLLVRVGVSRLESN